MVLLLVGGLLLAFGLIIKLIPTRHNRQDERVQAYNRTLSPLLTAMMVGGLGLIAVGILSIAVG